MTLSRSARYIGMTCNILGHYDTALFGILTPFIATLFFNQSDPVTALIFTYGILFLGIIPKPFGALFFGWMGDYFGQKQALSCSLTIMGTVTVLMGCLPTYSAVGIWSPILLLAGRMLQGFCAVGETTGASILLLENTSQKQRSLMSSFYDISSTAGAFMASGLVSYLCLGGRLEENWRLLFWIGGLPAFFALFLNTKHQTIKGLKSENQKWELIQILKDHRRVLVSIAIASGFSYTTYALAFTLMNGYVPLVTSLGTSDMMHINTFLLMIDVMLLPCFGYLAQKFGKEKIMLIGAFCSAIGAIPLFYCLSGASLPTVITIRFLIVFFGVAFAAPFHAWKLEHVPTKYRYTILALGCTLGHQLIGAPTSAICLWMYRFSKWVWAPGLYLMLIGTLAGLVVYLHSAKLLRKATIS